MRVFLSWSGERSRAVAHALKTWIPDVIQVAQPWISSSDIDKGARWPSEIGAALAATDFGVVVVTPENKTAPWLTFEAGALSKSLEEGRVATFLIGLEPNDLGRTADTLPGDRTSV